MSWANLLTWLDLHYWFNSYPGPLGGLFLLVIYGLILTFLLVGAVVFAVRRFFIKDSLTRQLARRLNTLTLTLGILLGVFLFFSQTQTPVLGSRFWFLLWLGGGAAWLVKFIYYLLKVVPRQRRWRLEKQKQVKYLSTTK